MSRKPRKSNSCGNDAALLSLLQGHTQQCHNEFVDCTPDYSQKGWKGGNYQSMRRILVEESVQKPNSGAAENTFLKSSSESLRADV